MCSRMKRMTFLAVTASIVLLAPLAIAAESPRCAALANSALAEPDWYLDECLGGVRPEVPELGPGPWLVPHSWLVPGDLFYLHNIRAAGQFPSSVYTAPIPTYTFTLLGANALTIFAMDFDNTATTLWGINNTTRGLGTYNLTTGVFTQTAVIAGIPVAENISGLKFDPTSTTVYASSTIALYTLDTATGVATPVGPYTHAAPAMIDIAISNTGLLFGEDLNDNFYSINKTTGATTLIGPTGIAINFAQGMDFDNSDNVLYQFAYVGAGVNSLRRIDPATGVSTLILTGPVGPEQEGSVKVASTPAVNVAPISNAVDAGGNGVFQPNETATMAPTWRNNGTAAVTLTGALSAFTGPAGGTYTIVDGAAAYTIAPAANASCGADCYSLTVAAATRPAVHWDTTVLETLNPSATTKTWTLHIGDSFTDVLPANAFYRFIETILHKNVTGGCTPTTYCPAASTTREQMAVFVLVSKEPAGYVPVACGATPTFPDVPVTSGFCRWVEELARRGVVSGCGGGNYCPTASATREQMAVFVLRTLDPTLNPPACVAGSEMFADVPATSGFCRWIEELVRRGVVTGCGGGNYCPTADVTREQMSVFLTVTFAIALYGL
jgi:S-layer family protein